MTALEKAYVPDRERAVSALETASKIFAESWMGAESDYAGRCAEILSWMDEKAVPMAYAAFSGSVASVAATMKPPAGLCEKTVESTFEKVGNALGIEIRKVK